MSILTKEQMNTVENMRNDMDSILPLNDNSLSSDDSIIAYQAALNLLEVIDDLQARAPRQYTEQELREWFENRPLVQDEIDALLHEVVPGENAAWYSVLKFAAHVGALKAEP